MFHRYAAAAAALLCVCAGCGHLRQAQDLNQSPDPQLADTPGIPIYSMPAQPVSLPADADGRAVSLAQLPADDAGTGRRVSAAFTRENLNVGATQIDPKLPVQNAITDSAAGTLALHPTGDQTLSQWGYATWKLTLPGFSDSDLPQSIHMLISEDTRVFPGASTTNTNAWIGLANQQTHIWDFYALPKDVLLLDSFKPYIAADGTVTLTLLARGVGEMKITGIRIGDPKVVHEGAVADPFFDPAPTEGFAPLAAPFNLKLSTKSASSTAVVSNTSTGLLQLDTRFGASIDLAPKYPGPRDQLDTYACTAFATSNALSYAVGKSYGLNLRDLKGNNDINHILSVPDIYLESKRDPANPNNYPFEWRSTTRVMTDVLKWLTAHNVPREAFEEFATFDVSTSSVRARPYNSTGMTQDRTSLATTLAAWTVTYDYRNDKAKRRDQINDIRYQLSQGHPITVVMQVDGAFDGLHSAAQGWNYTGTGLTYMHAMCIVGYDDNHLIGARKGAFKLLNSYGTGWGSGGYAWVGYQTFEDALAPLGVWWLNYGSRSTTTNYLKGTGAGQVTLRSVSSIDSPIKVTTSAGLDKEFIHVAWTPCPGATGYYIFRDAWPESSSEFSTFQYGWFQADTPDIRGFDDYALPAGNNAGHVYTVVPTVGGQPRFDLMSGESNLGYPCQPPDGINVYPDSGAPNTRLTLTAIATISCPTQVTWDFGAGAIPSHPTGDSVTVKLAGAGDYPCRVRLDSDAGHFVHDFTLHVGARTASVSGVVHALDGTPLANTEVILQNESTHQVSAIHSVVSDAQGSFSFPNVPEGNYTVAAQLTGWEFTPQATVSVTSTDSPAPIEVLGFTVPDVHVRIAVNGNRASFDASDSSDQDGGGLASYRWDFDGDGVWDSAGPQAVVSHDFGKAGIYEATVQATDTDSPADTGTAQVEVRVGATSSLPPSASLTVTPDYGYAPLDVLLNAGSSHAQNGGRIVKYEWDTNGDGVYELSGTSPTASAHFAKAGSVTIRLRITTDTGHTALAIHQVRIQNGSQPSQCPPSPGCWKQHTPPTFSGCWKQSTPTSSYCKHPGRPSKKGKGGQAKKSHPPQTH